MVLHKDLALDALATAGNVAQFVAFRPDPKTGVLTQSTSRIAGHEANARFGGPADAAARLLAASVDGAVNVRSYDPDDPRSREFVYAIRSVPDAVGHLERLGAEGLHLILNETIDTHDGGVSGVAQGPIIEFAPDDTPRAVEKPDVCSLPLELGCELLARVYGFRPELPPSAAARIEFSIHPSPRGWRQTNTLLWEIEEDRLYRSEVAPHWPNRMSRHIGDKAFGLLIADLVGARVPTTTVVGRRVAPFTFGVSTGQHETWIRTCPREPQPGLFTTRRGWMDPFRLLAEEDPDTQIASVLAQSGVRARWSGAAIVTAQGELVIEGRAGEGDVFMLGTAQREPLPEQVLSDVRSAHTSLSSTLGSVRIEWVHDGEQVWIVQLHVGATRSSATAIVEGDAEQWVEFDVAQGLPALRSFLVQIPPQTGLVLAGDVGLTSHVADVVRKWGRPARIDRR